MVDLTGGEKRFHRGILKMRPVDLKVGKRGLNLEFIKECRKVLFKDGMIKLGLPGDKEAQKRLIEELCEILPAITISKVGKTAGFIYKNE